MPTPSARLRWRWQILSDHATDARLFAAFGLAWRLICLALVVLVVGWDAAGLLILGDSGYAGPAYDVLRTLTPWGMRGYGPPLAVIFVGSLLSLGRHRGGRGWTYIALRGCMALTAAWYTLWAMAIGATWIVEGAIQSWGIGKLVFIALVAMALAWLTPTEPTPRRK